MDAIHQKFESGYTKKQNTKNEIGNRENPKKRGCLGTPSPSPLPSTLDRTFVGFATRDGIIYYVET